MLNRDNMPADCLKQVKRHLNITWSDSDTDDKIIDMMMDAEVELNHILGAEGNYFAPGMPEKAVPELHAVRMERLPERVRGRVQKGDPADPALQQSERSST